jgi:hypothetical protein
MTAGEIDDIFVSKEVCDSSGVKIQYDLQK